MKTPGEYALMHANGTPWAEIVRLIREEAVGGLSGPEFCDETCDQCEGSS